MLRIQQTKEPAKGNGAGERAHLLVQAAGEAPRRKLVRIRGSEEQEMRERVMEGLRYLVKKLHEQPTLEKWTERREEISKKVGPVPAANTIANYFGNWKDAVVEAGVASGYRNGQQKGIGFLPLLGPDELDAEKGEIKKQLLKYRRDEGSVPTTTHWETYRSVNPGCGFATLGRIRELFGSWNEALEYAGMNALDRTRKNGR